MLMWTLFIVIVCFSQFYLVIDDIIHFSSDPSVPKLWLFIIPILVTFVSAPLSGWLADAKFGNYKVFRAGAVLLFVHAVMTCLLLILRELVMESHHLVKWIHLCVGGTLFVVGGCACFVTALPLGQDQMPDASSSNITSYIAWFVCSIFIGGFVSRVSASLIKECLDEALNTHTIFSGLYFCQFI